MVIALALFSLIDTNIAAFEFSITHPIISARKRLATRVDLASDNHSSNRDVTLRQDYSQARNIRTLQGHDAAVPYYQKLLLQNPDDRTAGTRLAASPETPLRHDEACGGKFCSPGIDVTNDLLHKRSDIQILKAMLCEHSYDHKHISQFLGVQQPQQQPAESDKSLSCDGPLFASPVSSGSVSAWNYPLSRANGNVSGFSCLVALFLLSLVVPRTWIVEAFGEENCILMQDFGWMYPCSSDTSLMIPYVNVFPLDFDNNGAISLYLVTDLHPRVLSTTTVGKCLDHPGNTVMYIGPDSLALTQHFSPYPYLVNEMAQSESDASPHLAYGLDLGTGSGIQALSALMHWKLAAKDNRLHNDGTTTATSKDLKMIAIDINPRALRFTQFNAILNGLEDDVSLIHADLVSGRLCAGDSSRSLEECLEAQTYDLILANPPFLPVPSDSRTIDSPNDKRQADGDTATTIDSIAQRYGLFSSGGGDGEVILQRIVELASRHLSQGGVLGIVSEFFEQSHDPSFERFSTWWNHRHSRYRNSSTRIGKDTDNSNFQEIGILFLNEFPIDAATYAARRADNSEEETIWNRHLESLNVTAASPGMLYLQKGDTTSDNRQSSHHYLNLTLSRVPKTSLGSVWTPSNLDAIGFTQDVSRDIFGWP